MRRSRNRLRRREYGSSKQESCDHTQHAQGHGEVRIRLPRLLPEAQFPERFWHMKARLRRVRRAPRGIKARLGWSLYAKEVHAPVCFWIKRWRDASDGQ